MQCSKITSKDERAVRSESTTQEPRRALRITRLLYEILLSCLRRTRFARKSKKNRPKIDEHPTKIDPESKKNRVWTVWSAQVRFGDASRRARDSFCTPQWRPKADFGSPGRAKSDQEPSKRVAQAPHERSKSLRDSSQDVRNAVRMAKRTQKRLRIEFWSIFGHCAEAPKCVSYWFLQCFFDVGRFAR